MWPSVPAKHEFVEIALQMALLEAVEDAFRPSLQIGEDAVNPVQDLVRLAAGDDFSLMRLCGGIFVSEPAVRDDVSDERGNIFVA